MHVQRLMRFVNEEAMLHYLQMNSNVSLISDEEILVKGEPQILATITITLRKFTFKFGEETKVILAEDLDAAKETLFTYHMVVTTSFHS